MNIILNTDVYIIVVLPVIDMLTETTHHQESNF